MANVMKATRGALGHLFKHYERGLDGSGEPVRFGNQNIDSSRSHLNYNLAPKRDISQGEFVRQRCSEVYCLKRKDVNVMCSWVVTMPKDLPEHLEEDFFKETYKFLAARYGGDQEQNIVSAYVHKDEVTPHLHFAFIPVTYDKKKDRYKVSAKDVINRTELQRFHKELQAYLETALGCPVNVLNEATLEGNKSIEELKRGTATEELAKLKAEIQPYKDLVTTAETIAEEAKRVPRLPFTEPKVQVTEKTWETVKEQAKAYSANKKEIAQVRKTEAQQIVKGREFAELKRDLEKREQELAEKIAKHADIYRLLEEAESKVSSLTTEKAALRELISKRNSTIQALQEELKSAQQTTRGAYESLANVVEAVGMLKYDEDEDYKADLTKKQGCLIDAIAKYGSRWAKKDGFPDLSEEMDKKIGISKGLKKDIDELSRKQSRGISR